MLKLSKFFIGALLGLGMVSAFADAFDAPRYQVVGNTVTVTYGSSGPAVPNSLPTGSTSTVKGYGVVQSANNAPYLASRGIIPGPRNVPTPVVTKIGLSAPIIGRTLFKGAMLAAAAGTLWQAGNELYDVWTDLGYSPQPGGVYTSDPGACTVGPCYQYYDFNYQGTRVTQSCAATAAMLDASFPLDGGQARVCFGAPPGNVQACYPSGSPCNPISYNTRTVDPAPASVPLTEQALADAIASRSGWPTSTAVALQKSLSYPQVMIEVEPLIKAQPNTGATVKLGTDPLTATSTFPLPNPWVSTRDYLAPNGDPMTETKTETTTATAQENKVSYNTNTVTNVTNNTTNITNPVESTNSPAPAPEPAEEKDIETCGLPNKPKCILDETGVEQVKDQAEANNTPEQDATNAVQTLKDFLEDPASALPEYPSLNWAFTMPTGCSSISLPGFEPFLSSIDICQFQALFHDLMSVVWVMGGLFGAIGLFWRNTLATA